MSVMVLVLPGAEGIGLWQLINARAVSTRSLLAVVFKIASPGQRGKGVKGKTNVLWLPQPIITNH
jgi:hypothetical protein